MMLNVLRNKFILISLNPIGIMAKSVGIKNKATRKYKFKLSKIFKSFATAIVKISANPIQENGTLNIE